MSLYGVKYKLYKWKVYNYAQENSASLDKIYSLYLLHELMKHELHQSISA